MRRVALFAACLMPLAATDRQVYYAETNTANSTTSTSWQTQTSITFTPDSNKAYVIIGQWQYANGSSFVGAARSKLYDGSSDCQFYELAGRNDGSQYYSNMGMCIYPSTASPSSKTYSIQYASSSGSTASKIKNAHIIAIRLESDDQYTETLGTASTSSSSFSDRISHSNSASGTNDFIVLGACEFLHSSAGSSDAKAKLVLNGTDYGTAAIGDGGSVGYQGYSSGWQVSLANANTAKLQYASRNGNSITIRNARVVLLKASNFPATFSSTQQTRQTRANTAYADALSYGPSLNGTADYLFLGFAVFDYSNTTDVGYAQFRDAGTTIVEGYQRVWDTAVVNSLASMDRVTSVASGTRTFDWQHKSSSSGTTGTDEMSILALQLTDVAGGGPTLPPTLMLMGVGK